MRDDAVLVVGGGIGGLVAALALARKGVPVRLFEQSDQFKEIGGGIQLAPNVFRMFEILGLTEEIRRLATFPENLIMLDATTGREVTRLPVGGQSFLARFGGYPYAVVHRADLLHSLLSACRTYPSVELNLSKKALRFEESRDSVRLHFDDGTVVQGPALIGADGLWSRIRAQIAGERNPRMSGHVAYRAVLPTNDVPKELLQKNVVLWAGPKLHLVHYPLRDNSVYNVVAVFHSDKYEEGWDSYGDPAELVAAFAPVLPVLKELVAKIDTWRMWALCDREPMREWSHGAVTLLGDSAHPTMQYLAQGANMAIEDAVVLAACARLHNRNFRSAFKQYQDLRYLRTARVQITSRYYGDIYHAGGVVRELRNEFLTQDAENPSLEGMAWLYDGIKTPESTQS